MQLTNYVEISEVGAAVGAANNTDQNSDILDMANWQGVVFVVPVVSATTGGVATLHVEQNSVNSDSGMTAVTGGTATKTSATANTLLVVDVFEPRERYVQGVVTTATQTVAVGNTIAIKYGPRKMPPAEAATIADLVAVVSPA